MVGETNTERDFQFRATFHTFLPPPNASSIKLEEIKKIFSGTVDFLYSSDVWSYSLHPMMPDFGIMSFWSEKWSLVDLVQLLLWYGSDCGSIRFIRFGPPARYSLFVSNLDHGETWDRHQRLPLLNIHCLSVKHACCWWIHCIVIQPGMFWTYNLREPVKNVLAEFVR